MTAQTPILPPPFEWIADKGYSVARYPLTNAQFFPFIEADGYTERRWWTDAGWLAREQGWYWDQGWKSGGPIWHTPAYWDDALENRSEHPVVGVSWYEAMAFCAWLSEISGHQIRLLSETQWQYAAQGEDERRYPWGDEWDVTRCNHSAPPDPASSGTTPVTAFEGRGDSPFGVVDMSGNVWEWCLTEYPMSATDASTRWRVKKGGAWLYGNPDMFTCAHRGGEVPFARDPFTGFRLCLLET